MKTPVILLSATALCILTAAGVTAEKKFNRTELFLKLGSANEAIADTAMYRLAAIGQPAVDELLQLIWSSNRRKSEKAAVTLSLIANPEKKVVPGLVRALKAGPARVRENASWSLSMLGGKAKDAIPVLISSLKDSNRNVRFHSIWALSEMGISAKGAIPYILALRHERDIYIKDSVTYAVNKIRTARF